jgi:hypothetical protein
LATGCGGVATLCRATVAAGETDAADCVLSSDIVIATTAASIRHATKPAATLGPRDDAFGVGADACEVCWFPACDADAMIAIPVAFAASSFSERESICDLGHARLAMH